MRKPRKLRQKESAGINLDSLTDKEKIDLAMSILQVFIPRYMYNQDEIPTDFTPIVHPFGIGEKK